MILFHVCNLPEEEMIDSALKQISQTWTTPYLGRIVNVKLYKPLNFGKIVFEKLVEHACPLSIALQPQRNQHHRCGT